MYEKLEVCPSCGYTQFKNYLICEDHAFSKESFALVKCVKCELVFTNPRPDINKIMDYYKSDQYISHTNKSNSLINFIYKIVRNYTLKSKYKLILQYRKGKRILDFGAGTGHFINYVADKNWDAYAYEPHISTTPLPSVKYLETIKAIESSDKFDIITAWHVLEHVHALKDTLKVMRKRLKKGGYIFIAVPNINAYDATYYQESWAAYDVPRHLYHFSKKSFKYLAHKSNLNIVKIYPMKFDSFYVSMLSEKYKGRNHIIKALQMGLKSNAQAQKTGEYASLIYVLKG